MNKRHLFAVFGVIFLLSVACSATPDALTFDDEVAIYSAVVRRVTGPDDTFGGTLEKPIVYIITETTDVAGDSSKTGSEPQTLSVEVREGISANLIDLPSTIIWVDDREQVELDANGMVVGGGVIITLGNIEPQDSGEAHVAGSIYIANLAAGGQTYVLEKRDRTWVITGNTGVQWIS